MSEANSTKKCRKCGGEVSPRMLAKKDYQCASCKKKMDDAWRQRNRERDLATKRLWHQKNREAVLAKKREYYREHLEEHRERMAAYRAKNKEKIADVKREYRKENRKQDTARIKKWRKENAGRVREWARRKQKKQSPEQRRAAYLRYIERHGREKLRARRAVAYALSKGKLTKKPCESCGNPLSEAHHADYSRRLDVTWLCHDCHVKEHFPESDVRPPAGTQS